MTTHTDPTRAENARICAHWAHAWKLYHGRPTERLAYMIAATLVGPRRHSPDMLVAAIAMVDELRARLTAAKV